MHALNYIPQPENQPASIDPRTIVEKLETGYVEAAQEAHMDRDAIQIKLDFYRSFHHRMRRHPRETGFVQVDDAVEFETVPLVRATMRQEVALFAKNLPKYSLLPRGTGVQARMQARMAEQYINGLVTCYPAFYEAIFYGRLQAAITGLSYIKTGWDEEDSTLGPLSGGPSWEYISRLDAFPNVRVAVEKDVYRMYHRKVLPMERALELFSEDWEGRRLTESDFSMGDFRYENQLSQANGVYTGRGSTKESTPVEIIEVWMKPSKRLPLGGMVAFSGRTILAMPIAMEGGAPLSLALPDGYWPWTRVTGLNKVPGRYAADGLMHDLIPMQMTINDYFSNIKEAAVNSSQNWLLASKQSEVVADDTRNVSGTIIFYEQNFKPEWQQAPGPNQGIMAALDQLVQRYSDTSTQLDAARGVTNEANAKLVAVQTELSTALHGPDLTIWANSELAALCKNTLAAVAANATEEHYLAILGPNNQPGFTQFDPEVFHPNYQFVVIPGFEAPASREAQEAKILEAATAGLFADTPDAKRARSKMTWLQDAGDLNDPKEYHRRRVEMEQVLFVTQGIVPTLLDRDDDETHLDADETFSISPEFLAMPPELQDQYLLHMQGHQVQLQAKQSIYAGQAATLSAGAGPAKPGPEAEPAGAETPWSGGASTGGSETSGDEFSAGEIAQEQGP